jgi:hypothetical protein
MEPGLALGSPSWDMCVSLGVIRTKQSVLALPFLAKARKLAGLQTGTVGLQRRGKPGRLAYLVANRGRFLRTTLAPSPLMLVTELVRRASRKCRNNSQEVKYHCSKDTPFSLSIELFHSMTS